MTPHRFLSWQPASCCKLQGVAQKMISYFKSTLELKQQLLNLHLPPNTHLFTTDAVSMYTNFLTHMALNLIGKHLAQHQRTINGEYPRDAVQTGLRLVMTLTFSLLGILHSNNSMGPQWAPHQHHHM